MKIVAVIQARMGSTRLPGKVLLDLEGDTVLARVIHRVRRAALISEIMVATTNSASDDPIVRECERLNVLYFRGSENDVLDRYYRAALECQAEAVVRITSDCPVIDSEVADTVIRAFLDQRGDYASNTLERTYPRGLDVEVCTIEALKRAWQEARSPHEREHVTPYFFEHPELFRLISTKSDRDCSLYRWTVDTPEDFQLLRAIYERLSGFDEFGWRQVLSLMEKEPQLGEMNAQIRQKPLH